jgi:oxygen-independent coproporphyrinogen-3 oxidase
MKYVSDFPVSLYLHIPFCSTKCTYCAFNTYTQLEHLIPAFVEALAAEVRWAGLSAGRPVLHTVFFGGGTPSLLNGAQFAQLFGAIRESFALADDAEITLEANPNDITLPYAQTLREVGFNRVSLGMQTAHASELALFRRRHDNDAVALAVRAFRRAGFESLNLDLMYGFPHQTLEGWQSTLEQALALQPDHLSLYALSLEPGTPLAAWVQNGRLPAPDDDLAADMYELADGTLAAAGLAQYEISNWARPGHACRHNLQYWRNLEYIGAGPGAHGFAGGHRTATVLPVGRYITCMGEASLNERVFPHSPALESAVPVTRESEIVDTLLMGLRLTQEGIVREQFRERFGVDVLTLHPQVFERYAGYGVIDIQPERVSLTPRGRLLSNSLFRELV